MALVPDPEIAGLWAAAPPLAAGLHAVIIGVSDYPYLRDGSAAERAPNHGGLGQLELCARTAARVFDWLHRAVEVAGAPVATCRLMLAPRSAEEKAFVDGLTGGHYGPADFVTIRAAIEAWADSIFAGGRVAGSNVAFFFFSGHGVEIRVSPALLAKDILNPRAAGGANKAIALRSLLDGVKTLGIDRGLLFVDACRDAPAVAATLNMVGVDLIETVTFPSKTPDALICLQSTRANAKAYQVPGDEATIFGQAVLEALDGPPPSYAPYDTTVNPWQLRFSNLEGHVKARVIELLKAKSTVKIMQVDPYGDPYHAAMLVAEKRWPQVEIVPPVGPSASAPSPSVPAPAPSAPAPSPSAPAPSPLPPALGPSASPPPMGAPPPTAGPALDNLLATRSSDVLKEFTTLTASAIEPLRARAAPDPRFRGDLANYDIMHEILRHESVTDPWRDSLRILDVDSGEPVPETVRLVEGRSQQVGNSLTAWVDIAVAPGPGKAVWIAAGGREAGEPSCAIVVARDRESPVPVRLDIAYRVEDASGPTRLESMSARLAAPQSRGSEVDEIWQSLWEIQRLEALIDLGSAGTAAAPAFGKLKAVVEDKVKSPLAAAVAETVLLRCGRLDDLHDWPRNLANWFEWLPDGPLLWAETLLRRHDARRLRQPSARVDAGRPKSRSAAQDDAAAIGRLAAEPDYEEARKFFAELGRRGPPLLAASLVMAVRQLPFWRRVLGTKAVSGADYQALEEACGTVERAAVCAASGGVFAGFVSTERQLLPADMLGNRRTAAAKKAAASLSQRAA
jgi:hypothetical protein